jgi:hypothetical protein
MWQLVVFDPDGSVSLVDRHLSFTDVPTKRSYSRRKHLRVWTNTARA